MGRADGHDARAELDADGDVVRGREAALAEADGQRRLSAARVPYAHELGYVVPRRRRHVQPGVLDRRGEGGREERVDVSTTTTWDQRLRKEQDEQDGTEETEIDECFGLLRLWRVNLYLLRKNREQSSVLDWGWMAIGTCT